MHSSAGWQFNSIKITLGNFLSDFLGFQYRVVHLVEGNLLLALKCELRFSIRSLYCSGTFNLTSTNCILRPDGSPYIVLEAVGTCIHFNVTCGLFFWPFFDPIELPPGTPDGHGRLGQVEERHYLGQDEVHVVVERGSELAECGEQLAGDVAVLARVVREHADHLRNELRQVDLELGAQGQGDVLGEAEE